MPTFGPTTRDARQRTVTAARVVVSGDDGRHLVDRLEQWTAR